MIDSQSVTNISGTVTLMSVASSKAVGAVVPTVTTPVEVAGMLVSTADRIAIISLCIFIVSVAWNMYASIRRERREVKAQVLAKLEMDYRFLALKNELAQMQAVECADENSDNPVGSMKEGE